MIRLVQLGIEHPHAAAYRETLWLLRDRFQVAGLLRADGEDSPIDLGPFAGLPVHTSLADLLAATRPDAAQVMLRNNAMGKTLLTLAREGIHIWAEKPVARRAADLEPLGREVRSRSLVFTAGYQSRSYPANERIRDQVAEGIFGPLTFAHMLTTTTTAHLRRPDGSLGHLFDPADSGGGILHWLGCHMIDVLLHITRGQPLTVSATTSTSGEADIAVEDVASVALTFAGNWTASLNYGYLLPTGGASPFEDDTPESGLYGQQGWVRWNSTTGAGRAFSTDPRWQAAPWQRMALPMPAIGGYDHAALRAMTAFANAVDGVGAMTYTVEQAMLVLAIIEAAYRSSASGARISLDPAQTRSYESP